MPDLRREIANATERYQDAVTALARAREALRRAVIAALRGGVTPTEVASLSPFSTSHIRAMAREEGIPPAAPGPKSTSRGSAEKR